MKNKLIYVAVVALAAACGKDSRQSATQQSYETVQEGSAAGVTSTIAGPGEVMPPITDTNADTTSAFALNPNAVPATPAPGYAPATALPTADPNAGTSYDPAPARPAPRVATSPAPSSAAPRPSTEPQPEETRRVEAPPAPPVDATGTTATTEAVPAEKPQKEAAPATPPANDTASEPAQDQPPTTTTTGGNE